MCMWGVFTLVWLHPQEIRKNKWQFVLFGVKTVGSLHKNQSYSQTEVVVLRLESIWLTFDQIEGQKTCVLFSDEHVWLLCSMCSAFWPVRAWVRVCVLEDVHHREDIRFNYTYNNFQVSAGKNHLYANN